jgi:hypothetical protein
VAGWRIREPEAAGLLTSILRCTCVEGYSRESPTSYAACSPGKYKLLGNGACASCTSGTYSPDDAKTSCTVCPRNSSSQLASSQCSCVSGHMRVVRNVCHVCLRHTRIPSRMGRTLPALRMPCQISGLPQFTNAYAQKGTVRRATPHAARSAPQGLRNRLRAQDCVQNALPAPTHWSESRHPHDSSALLASSATLQARLSTMSRHALCVRLKARRHYRAPHKSQTVVVKLVILLRARPMVPSQERVCRVRQGRIRA